MRGEGEQALASRPRHDPCDGARILSPFLHERVGESPIWGGAPEQLSRKEKESVKV